MPVMIKNGQKLNLPLKKITLKANGVLNALGRPDAELSVCIVGDDEMASLNEKYLNRKGATNVIAFPMQEGEFTDIAPFLLGDVVISADTFQKEAAEIGITAQQRFDQLLIHGILHLLGYDHEDDEEASIMDAKADKLLELIGKL